MSTLSLSNVPSLFGQTNTTYPTGYKAPRLPGGNAPDLNGFWQAVNTANWDIEEHGTAPSPFPALEGAYFAQPAGFSVVEGGPLPYKPEGLARRNKYRQSRLTPDPLLLENGRVDGSDLVFRLPNNHVQGANVVSLPTLLKADWRKGEKQAQQPPPPPPAPAPAPVDAVEPAGKPK